MHERLIPESIFLPRVNREPGYEAILIGNNMYMYVGGNTVVVTSFSLTLCLPQAYIYAHIKFPQTATGDIRSGRRKPL